MVPLLVPRTLVALAAATLAQGSEPLHGGDVGDLLASLYEEDGPDKIWKKDSWNLLQETITSSKRRVVSAPKIARLPEDREVANEPWNQSTTAHPQSVQQSLQNDWAMLQARRTNRFWVLAIIFATVGWGTLFSVCWARSHVEDGSSVTLPENKRLTFSENKLRVVKAGFQPRLVNTRQSLASLIFGEGAALEGFIFDLGARDRTSGIWFAWAVGSVVGCLVLGGILPLQLIWFSLLMLPMGIVTGLVLSVELVWAVTMEFEYYVLNMLIGLLFFGAVFMLGDLRCVFWFCYFPTLMVSMLADAYPAAFRTMFTKFFFISNAAILIWWNVILTTGMAEPRYDAPWRVGHATGNAASMTLTTTLTLLMFCYRNLKVAFLRPDSFVILKSPLLTVKELHSVMVEEDADGKRRHFIQTKMPQRIDVTARKVPEKSALDNGEADSDCDTGAVVM